MQLPNIPSPNSPVLIQMIRWVFSPMKYMEECAQKYGDIFTLRVGENFAPLVFVSNPEALQYILTNDTKIFTAPGEANSIFESLLGKNSVVTVSDKKHKQKRQLLMPPFHGERMRSYGDVIKNIVIETINELPSNQPFCIRSTTQRITLRAIMQAVFGLHEGERAQLIEKYLGEILDKSSTPLSVLMLIFPSLRFDWGRFSPWGKNLIRQSKADQLIYEEIQQRRQQSNLDGEDILSLLMNARDEQGEGMSDEELRDELMTLLVAGHETTATALAWAFYWIHKYPNIKKKLLQEFDSLGDNPDSMKIFKLPYLNAVCCETLRIHPVGMLTFGRVSKMPTKLGNYEIETDTPIVGSIYLTHHREDLYPQSKQFRPERFLEKQFSPYEYIPFGAGARRCIGMAFAQFEIKLALFYILSQWELNLINNKNLKPKRRGLVTAPEKPIMMTIQSRRNISYKNLESMKVNASAQSF
ncbi:MAG: cytochrome P450 [Cyanobacteria bacterium P01_A01_bin.84]